ncbi:transporter substrate-binding domain-containing protein [Pseudodesulfovibrio cashew]|uniref:Transporter substrate-binding domain-containing protein n=1 Tax=Pseudodesulfovibrio cashew TaxID=2678688 RepID=A0A6I6JDK6_9BACT|nr:transporter substrate-binding domain-containing protein [Pseudodesulfovibrio cashew]QGY39098.1 transporter substrate-binding domain-containing protein [Pseudodesulfovibrio cashew]
MKLLRYFFLAALFAVLPLRAATAEDATLPIVFEDYPPYEYVEDGEVKGINLDLIREAFRRMGVTPYFEPRPWKRAIYQLQAGEILALSSGFKTPEREKFALFPAPLAMETNVIACRAGLNANVHSLEDIRDLRVGVVSAYVYGDPFDSMTGLNKVEAQSSEHLLRMLLENRVDVAVGNKAVFRYLALKLNREKDIRIAYVLGSQPLYVMFSKIRGPKTAELAKRFGNVMKGMVKDGTFDRILKRY